MTPEDILDIAKRRGNDEAFKVAQRCRDSSLIKLIEARMNPPKPKRRTSVPQVLREGSGMHLAQLGFMQVDSFR
jgi:hypothetical protein